MAERYVVEYREYIADDELWDHYKSADWVEVDVPERSVWNRLESDILTEADALAVAGDALKTYRTVRVKQVNIQVTHTF